MSVFRAGMPRPRMAAVLTIGFRPFFLAATVWAAIALALWVGMLQGEINLPTRFAPVSWHIHEMLFGFVLASMAGFLLTAIPAWTGRQPIARWRLAVLAGLWALGRAVTLVSGLLPAWLAIVADLAFPVALCAVVAHEITTARNWRNLGVVLPLGLFSTADLLMHLEAADVAVPGGLGWRLGIAAPIILISVIAGRIVPAFTRNWLAACGRGPLPVESNWLDRVALGVLPVAMIGWACLPLWRPVGDLLILAGLLHGVRLSRWRGAATAREMLLLVLHVAYAWLVLGLVMLGLALLLPAVPLPAALHALTAGAIATMILAVMTRVTLGHTGRTLTANGATIAIYVFVVLAALFRIAAATAAAAAMPLLMFSAALWIAAFGAFTIVYGRMLLGEHREV